MNPHLRMLLRLFEAQIETECRFILMANDLLQRSNALPMRPIEKGEFGRAEQIQFAVRSLVIAAANVSKLAWGSSGSAEVKERRRMERAELRRDLGLTESSPFYDRNLRDDFEHIDTRLEKQEQDFPMNNLSIGGVSLGLSEAAIMGMGDPFGHYVRETGLIVFLSPFGKKGTQTSHSVSVPSLVAEAQRVLAAIESARMSRQGWIPHDDWLALQEELKAKDS